MIIVQVLREALWAYFEGVCKLMLVLSAGFYKGFRSSGFGEMLMDLGVG